MEGPGQRETLSEIKGGKHLKNNIMRMAYVCPYAIVYVCTHTNTHKHMRRGVHQPELQSKKTLSQNKTILAALH